NAINVSQSFETILVFKRQKCEIERDNAFNWTNVKLLRSLINSGMDQSQLYDKIFEIENSLGFKDRCERMFAYEHKDLRKEGEIITKKWEARSDEYEAAQKPAGSDNQEDDDYSWALFYQDIPLIKDEYDVLVYLEKFLKIPVPKVNSVFANFGFKAKDGHIIALGLYALNLDSLPEGLVLCQQLEEFNLGKNQLQELPPWVQYLEHLTWLNLEKNQLKSLPDWLGDLQNLESLDISDNLLSELPESLAFISGLRSLNIENNLLEVSQAQPILEFCKVHGCEILTNHAFNL
ncbi:MAG: leucine-rich repeat domain-containing protein, partial [Promethearchaeota archaeon]